MPKDPRIRAERAGGAGTQPGQPAAPTAFNPPDNSNFGSRVPQGDPLRNKTKEPAAPDASHKYVWIDTPNGGIWSLHQITPVSGNGNGNSNGNGNGTIVTAPDTAKTVANRVPNADGSTTIIYSDGTFDTLASTTPTGVGQNAKDIVNGFLAQAGMGPLTAQVWAQWGAGTSAPQILDYIRSTPEYSTRYPGMKALNSRGMNISEGQYSNIEQSYTNQLKSYGIPSGIFDTHAYMGSLIDANVTPADFQTRLTAAQDTILGHDANTIKFAQDTFGLSTGDLMAGYLDPKLALPTVEQNSKAMQIGGAALGSGFQGQGINGEITKAQADTLATQGISQAQALQGFGNLGQQTQFGQNLPGDISGSLTQQQLINAQFGSNAPDQLALKNLQARRLSDYNQSGQLAQDSKGVSGAGVSNLAT